MSKYVTATVFLLWTFFYLPITYLGLAHAGVKPDGTLIVIVWIVGMVHTYKTYRVSVGHTKGTD